MNHDLTVHFVNDVVYPGRLAYKIQRIEMARAFAQSPRCRRIFFYYFRRWCGRFDIKKAFHLPETFTSRNLSAVPLFDIAEHRSLVRSIYNCLIGYPVHIVTLFLFFLFKRFEEKSVVFTRGLFAPPILLWLKQRRSSFPLVITELHSFVFDSHGIKQKIIAFLQRYTLRQSDIVVTITAATKDDWVAHGISTEKILVLPDGIDLKPFQAIHASKDILRQEFNLPIEKQLIVYAGHLHPWKGVDVLVESAQLVQEKNSVVYIVGGIPQKIEEWRRRVVELGIGDRVVIYGHIERDQIPRLLKAADVLVLPNTGKAAISAHHTSPLKLFEYMASEVPIVASDLPSIRTVLDDKTAFFFTPDDSADLAKRIDVVLAHPDDAGRRARAALLAVEKYSWSTRVESILLHC